jgi:predicted secreted protein
VGQGADSRNFRVNQRHSIRYCVNKSPGLRPVGCIGIFVALASCAGESGASTSECHGISTFATKPVVTEIDGGHCLKLEVGRTAELRLTGTYRWSKPQFSGDAVELIPIAFLRDPGYSAWEVRAIRSGTSAISASGTCVAADCAKLTLALSVTIAVP